MVSDIQLKNAKPADKDYTISVDEGLTLLIKSTGSKLWRYRYSYAGKRAMISLGKYPLISIKQARAQRYEYAELLEKGVNPSTHKRVEKVRQATEKTFKEVSIEWFANKYQGKSSRYNRLVWARLENHAFLKIGQLPIKEIDAPMLFNVIESMVILPFLTDAKSRGYAAIKGGRPPFALCGLS